MRALDWPGAGRVTVTQNDVIRTAMSEARLAETVAQDLARQLMHPHLGFVLFFCSAEYDLAALGDALQNYFGGVRLVGCTSAGEITAQGYNRSCVSAIGFDHRSFSIACELIDEMERFSLVDAQQLVERLGSTCRSNCLAPLKGHSFALTLLDGLSSREEVVLAALSAAFGSIPHFGGSAGDDNHLADTHVYYQGRFHSGAAIVMLVNTWLDFEVFTTHHILPCHEKLVVTHADSQMRRVFELNAEPAAQEYARLVGVPVGELGHRLFAAHPLAVRINEQYYVRSIQKVNDDLSLTFYCAVENGIVLTSMRPGPLLPNLEALFERLEQRLGPPLLTIGCDCFLRRLEVESQGGADEVSAFLRRQRVIGFNTYGEQFNGTHINQTFTGVAIGRPGGRGA
ncbi:GfdT protein [Stutzerimonas kirkiae]|nr:GfdT protein [Stutzerimonas kirkiae]TBV16257.1 GfdT protein [Stutzerimonas kirkiae]